MGDEARSEIGRAIADPAVPAGPLSTRVMARLVAPGVDSAALESLVAWAVEHCPVTDAVRRAIPMSVEVQAGEGGG